MDNRKNRESNIELLRILAIMGVVFLHFMGGVKIFEIPIENKIVLTILEVINISAVNIFLIISGYFLITTNNRSLWKVSELLLETFFITLMMGIFNVAIGIKSLSVYDFLNRFIIQNYFVKLYIAVYLLSVFINICIYNCERLLQLKLLILVLILFSLHPFILNILHYYFGFSVGDAFFIAGQGDLDGHTIIHFSVMYIIGALIRIFDDELLRKRKIRYVLVILFCNIIINVTLLLINLFAKGEFCGFVLSYANPFIISEAVLIF